MTVAEPLSLLGALVHLSINLHICIKNISCRFEAERLAGEAGMRLYRTSVKEDLNVGSVFQHLAENYVNKVSKPPGER